MLNVLAHLASLRGGYFSEGECLPSEARIWADSFAVTCCPGLEFKAATLLLGLPPKQISGSVHRYGRPDQAEAPGTARGSTSPSSAN